MAPILLFDLDSIDLNKLVFDTETVEAVNPHRYEMRLLDGIVHWDPQNDLIVGVKHVRNDEFWVRGHIPDRPIFPGVLMVEASAQLASFAAKKLTDEERFIGFGGIENVKFRAQVVPGDTLYIIGKFLEKRPRRFKMAAQGVVNDQLAFDAVVVGMPI